jgi:hypothetical protein
VDRVIAASQAHRGNLAPTGDLAADGVGSGRSALVRPAQIASQSEPAGLPFVDGAFAAHLPPTVSLQTGRTLRPGGRRERSQAQPFRSSGVSGAASPRDFSPAEPSALQAATPTTSVAATEVRNRLDLMVYFSRAPTRSWRGARVGGGCTKLRRGLPAAPSDEVAEE